jgi:antitoxin component of MazEF toxin-antitoxin module
MRLSFRYRKVSDDIYRPVIPLQLSLKDGTSVTLAGLLDSGSDVVLIPRNIAESLELDIGKKVHEVDGVGGRIKVAKSRIRIILDDGKKAYRITHPVEVSVQMSESLFDEILIGRIPFFEEFIIEFNESAKRVRLTPSHRH